MGDRLTVVYYTSNTEYGAFAEALRRTLLETIGGLPLISVSQKPLEFGFNICVGDIGVSQENVMRQSLTGAKAAQTEFITLVEDDCLYPPGFFEFVPPHKDRFYYPEEAYVLWEGRHKFWRKNMRELTGIVGREHFITLMEKLIKEKPLYLSHAIHVNSKSETFKPLAPMVTVKTKRGMHLRTPHQKSEKFYSLPYWGTPDNIWEKHPCRD